MTATAIKPALTIKVGRKSHPIADYAEASRMTLAAVAVLAEREHLVSPHFTTPFIFEGKRQVAYVSQNGRVWAGHPREWAPGRTPLCEAQYPNA